jgi:outer membrane protein assembly factor BamB
MLRAALAAPALAGLVAACGVPIRGVVFVDHNRDGLRQDDEPGIAGVRVGWERVGFATTRGDGSYDLDAVSDTGLVWVRVPDGYRPGAVWRWIDSGGGDGIDLGVVPITADEAAAPLTFVVASDSHVTADPMNTWDGGDLVDAIDQALGLPEPPRFFTIVGDITQSNTDAEFERIAAAVGQFAVPWVPVAGNHDWYDGGANYRRYFGPDNYAFDAGGVHFVVWDTNLPDDDQIAFLAAELADVPMETVVVAIGHFSPSDAVADEMNLLGVDYLFTGHWHANRKLQRGAITEWGTQAFVMGGIDASPSGYRVVTMIDGVPQIEYRDRLVTGHLDVTAPHPGTCASETGFPIVVAAALDATIADVSVRVDCGEPMSLVHAGGWAFRGTGPALAPGTHSLSITATTPSGRSLERLVAFDVCAPTVGAPVLGDWLQVGGAADHRGARVEPIAPPLGARWSTTVGGSPSLGTPVVGGGVVVVAITDNGAGDRGGAIALDLATGAELWRYATMFPAVGAAAISGDTVVIATKSGEVHAVGLADGQMRWIYDAAEGVPTFDAAMWSPPTIDGGLVYVAVQANFAALDLATGVPVWTRDPMDPVFTWLGSLAAIAVADGNAIAALSRTTGVTGWNATTGAPRWSVNDGRTVAVNAAPVIDPATNTVYLANAAGQVSSANATTGQIAWTMNLAEGGWDWAYIVSATPALADGRLFVALQWSDLVALDATTGAELWRFATAGGPLNYAHYRSAEAGFPAGAIVTGDVVWIGGPDGRLHALDAATGAELWSTQLGAPIVSAPAPAGDALIVATYDGTIRALAPATEVVPAAVEACAPPVEPPYPADDDGCASSRGGTLAILIVVLFVVRRRQRIPATIQ